MNERSLFIDHKGTILFYTKTIVNRCHYSNKYVVFVLRVFYLFMDAMPQPGEWGLYY